MASLDIITALSLKEIIKTRLEAELVEVEDISGGCGQAFECIIVSKLFEGKKTIQRHRQVNSELKDIISRVHAFSQKSFTPTEWVKNAKGTMDAL
ncbi:putative bolA-like protein [Neolecta irregularis DAH-3]|uniref:Putative bolA-like protein n=1 Tax=Neolecta irregularis (strain DAH-3) TaxID=1198029 RepID=A0A1U7LIK7_NEOID|nr:putative bolA-like protein [Neolecta irregularis DAH-3]|eukprot:OLL22490.1 putative bolA-like protein [Neolecta irregularis DAH-3]